MINNLGKIPAALAQSLEKVKGSLLETMARRMSRKDALAMTQHWSHLFEKIADSPSAQISRTEPTPISPNPTSISPQNAPAIVQEPMHRHPSLTIPSNLKDEILLHPIFGRKLSDLGYKKIFLTNANSLTRAAVWEKQRILRPERAARIAQYKVQSGTQNSFVGVITMSMDKNTGKTAILDGQHRAAAYMLLAQQGHIDGHERKIVVDVFETDGDGDIASLFKEINSAEPVLLVDTPGEVILNRSPHKSLVPLFSFVTPLFTFYNLYDLVLCYFVGGICGNSDDS